MKTKCKTLKLSITISIISLITFSIFFFLNQYYENMWFDYAYNVSLGLFGSSFVVFLISIAEYRVAKIQLLERIWNESRNLNIQLYKIKPLHSKIDDKILTDYINEWLFRQDEKGKKIFGDKHEAYDGIYNFLLDYHKKEIEKMSKKGIKDYIDSLIESERKKVLEDLEKIIDQYLNLNKYSFIEMNNLLGDVQFFTGKKQYLQLHQNIYEPLHRMYNELKESICYHFQLYRNGEANRPDVLLSILLEHQEKLFRIEKKYEENCEWNIIYADFCDKMDDNIEEFRAKTIYQCKEEKINHHPIESIFYNKNVN